MNNKCESCKEEECILYPDCLAVLKWEYKGIKCYIIKHSECGYYCGYVALSDKEHWAYNKSYIELNPPFIFVHGGITFSEKMILDNKEYWVFGFDCGHSGDNNEYWNIERVKKETENLADEILSKPRESIEGIEIKMLIEKLGIINMLLH
mgnify:CR=1 FL=1